VLKLKSDKMKALFLSAIIILLALSTQAQQKIITFGVEGGIGISSLNYDNKNLNDIYDSRTGLAGGIALQYNFPKVLSLRSGAMLETKGDVTNITFTNVQGNITGSGEMKRTLGYLTVPLMLRATFGNKINLFVQGGPYWAALLSARVNLDVVPDTFEYEPDIKDLYESSEFGVSGGIGVSSVFNEMIVLSIEVRNNMGITDVGKNTYKAQTRSLLFLAGVALTVGSREDKAK
jgi:hypothetical protein